jgi:hypothetical protein
LCFTFEYIFLSFCKCFSFYSYFNYILNFWGLLLILNLIMLWAKKNIFFNFHKISCQELKWKDLGVMFDEKLSFSAHINNLYSSCLRLLGFILRTTKYFKNPSSVVSLFNSLIRSRLEYASCVWNSHQLNHNLLLEKLQKKMVKVLYFRNQILNPPVEFNCEECCEIMKISSLKNEESSTTLNWFCLLLWIKLTRRVFCTISSFFAALCPN